MQRIYNKQIEKRKEKLKMGIKLFSHNDLDGVSPYILLRTYFQQEQIHYTFCNCDDIDEKVKKFLDTKEYLTYDKIYITDISISEELAERLQKIANDNKIELRLFDHHATAVNLNKFEFCSVIPKKNSELICGTKLFYEYLITEKKLQEKKYITEYVKYVNDYDTWLWKSKYHYNTPNEWNTLFCFYGRVNFIENVLKKFEKKKIDFTETDKLILDVEASKKKSYIQAKLKEVIKTEIDNYLCAIVFAESYTNDLATKMKESFPEADILIIIGSKGISYRCRDDKDIHLDEFAKKFGGGGHPKAAGSQITSKMREQMIACIF